MAKTFSKAAVVAALSLSFAAGCTPLDNALASVPYLAFMRNSPFFDPYEAPRPAPPGSIPYSSPAGVYLPPMEGNEDAINAFAASPAGQNPFSVTDPAVLALGQKKYEQHCSVCHNTKGEGNGPIVGVGKFPMGPSLVAGTGLTRSDGYIYGIIRAGKGVMPSYGARTNHTERWAIASYVKQLQTQNAGGAAGAATAPATTPSAGAADSTTGTQTPVTQPAGGQNPGGTSPAGTQENR